MHKVPKKRANRWVKASVNTQGLTEPNHRGRGRIAWRAEIILQWADSSVMIKARIQVKPLEQWHVRREFLKRL
ncbi:MAG: hypothetical protein EBW52_11165, partial [Betaproteobacteria bacterium]|nr:hypothetical protein [Betaproteobacteria bacterium]